MAAENEHNHLITGLIGTILARVCEFGKCSQGTYRLQHLFKSNRFYTSKFDQSHLVCTGMCTNLLFCVSHLICYGWKLSLPLNKKRIQNFLYFFSLSTKVPNGFQKVQFWLVCISLLFNVNVCNYVVVIQSR